MKKSYILGAMMLLAFTTSNVMFTSCDNDDDNPTQPQAAKPEIKVEEIGAENNKEAFPGLDLHTEGDINAPGKVKTFTIEVFDKDGKSVGKKDLSAAPYVGVINPHFHEHVDIDPKAALGDGQIVITVVDEQGQTAEFKETIAIKEKFADVTDLKVGQNGNNSGKIGEPIPVTAHVKLTNGHKIASIEVEFHNETAGVEFPTEFTEKYAGKDEVDFNEAITLKDDFPTGECHVHFTVTDDAGNELPMAVEGVQISK